MPRITHSNPKTHPHQLPELVHVTPTGHLETREVQRIMGDVVSGLAKEESRKSDHIEIQLKGVKSQTQHIAVYS